MEWTSPGVPKGRVDSYDHDAPTPQVGSRWVWESTQPLATERSVVTEVKWNGEEWWVKTNGPGSPMFPSSAGEHWNDLSRFWEAVTPEADS